MKHRRAAICLLVLLLLSAMLAASCGSGAGDNGGSERTDNASSDNSTSDNGSIDSSSDNSSCSTAEADNVTQKYFFEVEYMNFAWGPQYNCMYIDRDGQIYAFDSSGGNPSFQRPENGVYTRALLDDKYSGHCVHVGTIDRETLARMAALIGPASQGQLTEPENTCYDTGGTAFNAFQFDPETGVYSTVLLRQCGDWSRRNTAPEAATLFEWLKQTRGGAACCY